MGRLVAAVPARYRLGSQFWSHYAFLRESESWTLSQMLEWQLERLRDLLDRVKESSPYYQQRLDNIDPRTLSSLAEFSAKVPPMTRAEFAAESARIQSGPARRRSVTLARTSGTTGAALQFFHSTDDSVREHAAICHQWSRVGYSPGRSVRAELRGLTAGGRRVEYFPEKAMVRFSILHLRGADVRQYADVAARERVEFLHGYPSAIHLLADTVIAEGVRFPSPRGVLLASEEVHPWQLDRIREAFPSARLFAHYGCAERAALAGWCEYREDYHVLPQYSLVEFDPVTSEVIGTNLYNEVNPFLRYRLTDTTSGHSVSPCPECGRPYVPRIFGISGRSEDYLFTKSRGWIPPALLTHPLKSMRSIREVRLVQEAPDQLRFQYTVRSGAKEAELEIEIGVVLAGLSEILGEGIAIVAERRDEFERSASGKFRWITNSARDSRRPSE